MRLAIAMAFPVCCTAILLAAPSGAQRPSAARCERIQVRLVSESPAQGARRYTDPATRNAYSLTDTVALDGRAVQGLDRESFVDAPGDTLWSILATIRPASANSVTAFFDRYRDRHVAVLIGEDIVQTAMIAGAVHIVPLRIQTSRVIADSLMLRFRIAIGPSCANG
jgi:hypothetical protein